MTAKQLRNRGWIIFFRNGWVIASNRKTLTLSTALRIRNNNGEWIDIVTEDPGKWETIQLTRDEWGEIIALRELCYCNSLNETTCDFCSQTRRHELLKHMREHTHPDTKVALSDWSRKIR